MAAGLADRGFGTVIAVDTWAGTGNEPLHSDLVKDHGPDQLYDVFNRNMRGLGLEQHVEAWRMTTLDAARRWDRGASIGLLHIDADHDDHAVRADFERRSPLVAHGGFIVFDDAASFVGPSRLISELPRWYRFFGAMPNKWVVSKE